MAASTRATDGQFLRPMTAAMVVGLLLLGLAASGGVEGGCDGTQAAEELLPCLPAAKPNPAPPSHDCCVLINKLSAECLCSGVQSPVARMEGVDLVTALQLPHKCRRYVPPGTKCGAYTVPGYMED